LEGSTGGGVKRLSRRRGGVPLRRLIQLSIIREEARFRRQFALGDPREGLGGGIDLVVVGGFRKGGEFVEKGLAPRGVV